MKLYRIKKSKIDNKGRGLYATKDIKEGTKIIDYKGKIITNKCTMCKGAKVILPDVCISLVFDQFDISFSPGWFTFGSQKLLTSQPPSACNVTNNLPV